MYSSSEVNAPTFGWNPLNQPAIPFGSSNLLLNQPLSDRSLYQLSARSSDASFDADFVANSVAATAIDIGTLRGINTYTGSVSSNSTNIYQFNLANSSSVNLSLTGLSADANVRLFGDFNRNGAIDSGEEITRSNKGGTTDESITVSGLSSGLYFAEVDGVGDTSYTLRISDSAVSELLPGEVDLGALTSAQTTGTINNQNTADLYRFSLSANSRLNLALTGLSNDADLRLIRDSNGNGIINAGEELARSQQGGSLNDTIALNSLAAGTYFVQVYQYSGSTAYTLNLSASAITTAPVDNAGNTLANARDIGQLSSTQTFNDFVGASDTNDFYRFTLGNTSTVNITLTGLSADADIELMRANGEIVAASLQSDSTSERINTGLTAGTYYLRVYPYSGSTNYTLTATATTLSLPANYSVDYGYGLVDAAAAVTAALGQNSFPAVADLGGNQWNLDLINAPEVWARGYTGQNTIVAVVDSGVDYTHPDLDANIWVNPGEIAANGVDDDGNGFIDDIRGWDFVGNDNNPTDGDGHGTHVAGTIAAENNSFGATGVAYNARIMPVRVLDNEGFGDWTGIAAGIRYAANNGADVINLSLGGENYSSEVAAAVQYASDRGAIVVIASGNEARNQPSFPANLADRWGIAVGAVDRNQQLANFSNDAGVSPLNYVVAPGVEIYSTTPGNTYQNFKGTSMASPHVAGVAALLLSANPALTPAQVASLLGRTAIANSVRV